MNEEISIQCPYCGESWIVEPEPSDEAVEYIEDCHICCRPILITIHYSENGSEVSVQKENS